jgi:hypothetical protein
MATKKQTTPPTGDAPPRKKRAKKAPEITALTTLPAEPTDLPPSVAPTPSVAPIPSEDAIRRRAYDLWRDGGADPLENWLRAERELRSNPRP